MPSLNFVAVTPDGRRILSAGQSTVPITQTKLKYGPRNVTIDRDPALGSRDRRARQDLHGEEDHGPRICGPIARWPADGGGRFRPCSASSTPRRAGRSGRSPCRVARGDRPAFSPDGTLVAMAIAQHRSALFEVATGRRLHHDEATPEGEFASGAWSPSGDRIVTGHSDGGVRVWDAATGKLIWHKVLAPVIGSSGWNARPAFVAFSGDGRLVVAAGRAG